MHLISRVTDGEFRIDRHARTDYLRRVGRIAPRTRWQLLAYALMSNHVHWALICRGDPIRDLFHPLHTGFGNWLNLRDKRHTPVFAQRPSTYLFEPSHAPWLISYLHNNPVRAKVATCARQSQWTSHRAYSGDVEAPEWLDVDAGLALCGQDSTDDGRAAFGAMVRGGSREPREHIFSGLPVDSDRRRIRRYLNAPIELATPAVLRGAIELPLIGVPGMPVVETWNGDLDELLSEVARVTDVPVERMRSRNRALGVVRARCLALIAGTECLGHSIQHVAATMGLSGSGGSKLLLRNAERREQLTPVAREIADRLRLTFPG